MRVITLVQYLETRAVSLPDDAEDEKLKLIAKARDVLERACTIHHLDKPSLHLRFAFFEENQGNAARASDILERLDKTCPNLLQVAYRRINLERRRRDYDKCCQLYESYISSSKSKATASNLSIKFARFLMRCKNDIPAATRTLRTALVRDPTCHRLYLQLVDVAMFSPDFDLKQVIGYLDEYLAIEGVEYEFRLQFTQLKLELQEEMGNNVDDIQSTLQAYQTLSKQQHKKKNKDKVSGSDNNSGKKKGDGVAPPLPPTSAGQNTAGLNSSGSGGGVGYGSSGYGAGTGGGTYNYSAPPPSQPTPQQHYDSSAYPPQPYQQTPWTQYQQPPNPYQHNPWTTYQNYY